MKIHRTASKYLGTPYFQRQARAGTIAHFRRKEVRVWIFLRVGISAISTFLIMNMGSSYNRMAINSHDKVKPRLQGKLGVFVAEYLEARCAVVGGRRSRVLDGIGIQTPNESIQSSKHDDGGRNRGKPQGSCVFCRVLRLNC